MSFLNFSKEEIVNVNLIDEQHAVIAGIVNKIYDSAEENKSDEIVINLDKLVEEIEIHFETEEKYMKENKFPGYFSHKLEHDRFYRQLLQTADKFKSTKTHFDQERLIGIRKWFFNHIEISDKKCGAYLNSIGIK